MAKARRTAGLVAGCLLLWGGTASVWAAPPTAAEILRIRPKQEGVVYTTPAPQEQEHSPGLRVARRPLRGTGAQHLHRERQLCHR